MMTFHSKRNQILLFVLGTMCFLFFVYNIKQHRQQEMTQLQQQIVKLQGQHEAFLERVEFQLQVVARLKAASGLPDKRLPWDGFDRRQSIHAMTQFPKYPIPIADEKDMCDNDIACLNKTGKHRIASTNNVQVREGQRSVRANGKILSYNDVAMSYERLFEKRSMHSTTTFMNVALQQDPSDAFAIGDLLWRVRPRLLIELGTSGGGSALYFARLMLGYDPHARIITIDPFNGPIVLDGAVLKNWNRAQIALFCPHCKSAADQSIWKHAVTFIQSLPTNTSTIAYVRNRVLEIAKQGFPIMVIEDSNHLFENVRANLHNYTRFVSPGSYFICQDTRNGKMEGPVGALYEFLTKQNYTITQNHSLLLPYNKTRENYPIWLQHQQKQHVWLNSNDSIDALWLDQPASFVRDRRPEYYIITQHAGGYLRRLEHDEMFLTPFFDEILDKKKG